MLLRNTKGLLCFFGDMRIQLSKLKARMIVFPFFFHKMQFDSEIKIISSVKNWRNLSNMVHFLVFSRIILILCFSYNETYFSILLWIMWKIGVLRASCCLLLKNLFFWYSSPWPTLLCSWHGIIRNSMLKHFSLLRSFKKETKAESLGRFLTNFLRHSGIILGSEDSALIVLVVWAHLITV